MFFICSMFMHELIWKRFTSDCCFIHLIILRKYFPIVFEWVFFVFCFFVFHLLSISKILCLLRSSIARALPKARVPKPSPASVAATKLSGTTTNSGCCPLLLSQLFYFITDSMWVWGLGFLTPKNFINKPPNWWLLFIQWRLMKIKIYCWYSKSH